MVKVEVIEKFDLKDFDKLLNIKRATSKDKKGSLYLGDTFQCDEKMAEYLTGNNPLKRPVVKIIEIEQPKEEVEEKVEVEEVVDVENDINEIFKKSKKETKKKRK